MTTVRVAIMSDVKMKCSMLLPMSLKAILAVVKLGLSRVDSPRNLLTSVLPRSSFTYLTSGPSQAESRPVNVQSALNPHQDEKRSGKRKHKEEIMIQNIFRVWFAKHATKYNTSKSRADTVVASQ